jgi:hypothetical protein
MDTETSIPVIPERPSAGNNWDQKAAEIDAKRRELDKREAELREREAEAKRKEASEELPANWPPFYPVLRHDIASAVPEPVQPLARQSYILWRLTAASYGLNLATGIYTFIRGQQSIFGLVLDLVYTLLFPLAAFFTWHMALYKALSLNNGMWFWAYFPLMALQLALYALVAIGFVNGSAGGLFSVIGAITTGKLITAILVGICTAMVTFNLFAGVYIIQAVARYYWNRKAISQDIAQAAESNPGAVQFALRNMA